MHQKTQTTTGMYHDDKHETVSITRDFSGAFQLTTIERPSLTEYFITAVPTEGRSPQVLFQKTAEILRNNGAQIVAQEAFGSPDDSGPIRQMLAESFGRVDWPLTWIEAQGLGSFAGTQVWAVSGGPVERLRLDGTVVGSLLEDECACYCRLGGLHATNASQTRKAQAIAFLERLEAALRVGGFEFADVVRTWFYLRDILSWYGEFNQARSSFYGSNGVLGNLVPASTGIGISLPAGPVMTGGLLAMKPVNGDNARATSVRSPLQCAATDYGSLFSRAVELEASGLRRLYVSGTASIAPDGRTGHSGDLDGQIARTIEVVSAILESRGMRWRDVVRGVAYVKNATGLPAWFSYCEAHGLPLMPILATNCDICRDDLLFELEVDAIRRT
jgi:enamine deaminase RidA (YjgF/YER057c/UK114 family)